MIKYDKSDVRVEIEKITGKENKYSCYSVFAKAWVDKEGDRFNEQRIRLNPAKDGKVFKVRESTGRPRIVDRLRKNYIDSLENEEEGETKPETEDASDTIVGRTYE